jgi:hypothetical protein
MHLLRAAERVAQQIEAMRVALQDGSAGQVPYLHVLLLSERLTLSELVGRTLGETLPEAGAVTDLVERLSPWSPCEREQPLRYNNALLGAVWEALRDQVSRPPYRADANDIASQLNCTRDDWYQWCARARRRVIACIGAERCQALFPLWPDRLFW